VLGCLKIKGGVLSGVNGTPTFFINGQRHDGSFDCETLASAIQQAISTAKERLGREPSQFRVLAIALWPLVRALPSPLMSALPADDLGTSRQAHPMSTLRNQTLEQAAPGEDSQRCC
jgi:hypothetical protein